MCRAIQSLGPSKSSAGMRIQLAKEWVTGSIQPYGAFHEKQVASLRKKIYEHRDSASHKQAASIQQESNSEKLKTVIVENQKQCVDNAFSVPMPSNVFRTVC